MSLEFNTSHLLAFCLSGTVFVGRTDSFRTLLYLVSLLDPEPGVIYLSSLSLSGQKKGGVFFVGSTRNLSISFYTKSPTPSLSRPEPFSVRPPTLFPFDSLRSRKVSPGQWSRWLGSPRGPGLPATVRVVLRVPIRSSVGKSRGPVIKMKRNPLFFYYHC